MGCISPITAFKHGLSNVTSRFFTDTLGICWTNQICPKCSFVTGKISHGGEGWSDSGVFPLCSISKLLRLGQLWSRHLLGSVVERKPRTNRITLSAFQIQKKSPLFNQKEKTQGILPGSWGATLSLAEPPPHCSDENTMCTLSE